ncbi:MAG: translation initiation factor IF-2 [Chloroflexi bacterium]|nr:translation initiation factor IF-2 [Chloroflexota bacterium]
MAPQAEKTRAGKGGVYELPHSLTVRQLAEILQLNAIDIIKQLMRQGIMASINQIISYESAAAVAKTFGIETRLHSRTAAATARTELKKKIKTEEAGNLQPRPPVVTVMGHVDHGKTRLLDAIRQTNVMATEAGAITQHIGAYQVTVNAQKITFLDTPGHEAFTAMRAHGAQITDIIILVVAADDGVMPQTIEAINHARAAGVPIVVAVNKMDKPTANPDRVKQQLAEAGLVVEEWGGETIAVPISAKEKKGIDELLENLLLVAEIEDFRADPARPAVGVVIEAEMDKSRGPIATVLIQNGTLKVGDLLVVGNTSGRVRAMFNDVGKRLKKAEPATPVAILGLDGVAQSGDLLNAVVDEHEAQALIERRRQELAPKKSVSLTNLFDQIASGSVKELDIILKTDVQGSIEPIKTSLEKLQTETVQVRIIHSGTGNINESDVMLAIASKGLVIGFSVSVDAGARRLATAQNVDVRTYDIIYNLIDDVEKAIKGLLEPTFVEVIEGRAEVRAIFSAGKGKKAAGVYVTDGKVSRNASVRVLRAGKKLLEGGVIGSLKRFKDDVREVAAGFECGVSLKDFDDLQAGDVLEFYTMTKSA